MRDWLPQALEAMAALAPLAQPIGVDAERAGERVRAYAGEMLAEAGLPELCELVGGTPTSAADAPEPSSRASRRGRPHARVRPRLAG